MGVYLGVFLYKGGVSGVLYGESHWGSEGEEHCKQAGLRIELHKSGDLYIDPLHILKAKQLYLYSMFHTQGNKVFKINKIHFVYMQHVNKKTRNYNHR